MNKYEKIYLKAADIVKEIDAQNGAQDECNEFSELDDETKQTILENDAALKARGEPGA
ncbi:MAG: hypothetical protein IJA35_00630 [Clostridia bacterium]|nr:hypothetical protein [Clostridia bacterium]